MKFELSKFEPMNNKILIKKDPAYDTDQYSTDSGIIVLNNDKPKDRYALATIIKLGQHMLMPNGHYKSLSDIWSVGDKVFYYVPAQGVPLEIDGEDYFLVRAEDIIQAIVQ